MVNDMDNQGKDLTHWSFIEAVAPQLESFDQSIDTRANKVALMVNRASVALIHDFESSIHRPAGSSWASFRVLFALWHTGKISSSQLSTATSMTRSAVSNISKTLEIKGLIVREPDPRDGRGTLVELTASGTDYIQQIFLTQHQREALWASRLTAVEQSLLIELLRKLTDPPHIEGE